MEASSSRLSVSCESCGARMLFDAHQRSGRCPYCDSPNVVDRPATYNRPDPLFALRILVSSDSARERLRQWIKGKRMGPKGLRKRAQENGRAVYLPTYLYSATAHSRFRAEIREDYKRGKERKREYRVLTGKHAAYLGDILVTASRGVPNHEVERIEPFYTDNLLRYSPKVISGWTSEEPSMTREECLALAREESGDRVRGLLESFMPGDGHRNLRFETDLAEESLDLTLVPVWVFSVQYDENKPPFRVLVNGQTGKVYGKVPISWRKVLLLALSVACATGVFLLFLHWLGAVH